MAATDCGSAVHDARPAVWTVGDGRGVRAVGRVDAGPGVRTAVGAGDRAGVGVVGRVRGVGGVSLLPTLRTAGDGVPIWQVVLGAALLAGAALGAVALRRRRSGRTAGGDTGPGSVGGTVPSGPVPLDALRARAAAALVDADDAVRTSRLEVDRASAQVGVQATAPFGEAVASSAADVAAGLVQWRTLRAAEEAEQRDLLEQVLATCERANQRLDAGVPAFDALRDLEGGVVELLAGLGSQVDALHVRSAECAELMDELAADWPPAARAMLGRALDQADERLAFARLSVDAGADLSGRDKRGDAAAQVRAAEDAIDQADLLYDFVADGRQILQMARDATQALMAAIGDDVAAAQRLGPPPELEVRHDFAVKTLAWVSEAVASGTFDPIATRRALESSDAALQDGLAPLLAEEDSRRRAEALLPGALDAGAVTVRVGEDYVTTRRGAVGVTARCLVEQARGELAAGQAATDDPVTALHHLQEADRLADAALALAQQDEARFADSVQRGPGPGQRDALILGGILIDPTPTATALRTDGGARVPGPRCGPASFGGPATRNRRSGGGVAADGAGS